MGLGAKVGGGLLRHVDVAPRWLRRWEVSCSLMVRDMSDGFSREWSSGSCGTEIRLIWVWLYYAL